jgi:hypothetical protein
MNTDEQVTYADKIAKLLRKAETTDSVQEAEALTAKAQALMVRFAISEELLRQATGEQEQDHIENDNIVYRGIFHMALFDIGRAVADTNNCFVMIHKHRHESVTELLLVGYTRDISNVKVLDASIQVQASSAMQAWYRQQDTSYRTPMQKSKMRREFLFGFAKGLKAKLLVAKRVGLRDATDDEAKRAGVDVETAGKSTDLVLRTKDENIKNWVDNEYGNTLRTVRRNYSSGGYQARNAGFAAGQRANIGQPSVGGSRRQIGG